MKLSLVIPTYDEKENIQKLIKKIMEENYKLVFECSKDPEVNWIYSNNK